MYEGMDMGTLWRMKNEPNGPVYRVVMHSFGSDEGPTVTFECNGEMTRTVAWVRENMRPVVI